MPTQRVIRRVLFLICSAAFFCLYVNVAAAPAPHGQENAVSQKAVSQKKESSKPADMSGYVGSETCATCHEEEAKRFNKTPMGKAFAHPKTDEEKLGCESCHGPGQVHAEAGTKETVAVRFTKGSLNTVEEKNNSCLSCHTNGRQMFWKGSPHESRAMACVDCHQGHPEKKEARLSADARFNAPLSENSSMHKPQPELCLTCHQMRKAQLQRSSHMPYREGKVTCSSCHNPHGTPHPKQLIQATTNENCLSCHTERRGPFAWEHPPVMENCANCHEPHGTSNPQLLKVRMPRLCDSCHVMTRHPTQAQPLSSNKNFNRGCTNCHSQIHGTNHPSGKYFLR